MQFLNKRTILERIKLSAGKHSVSFNLRSILKKDFISIERKINNHTNFFNFENLSRKRLNKIASKYFTGNR